MQKDLFEDSGCVLVCKILPVGRETGLLGMAQDRTDEFREDGMSLMCKIQSDKQQKGDEDKIQAEDEGEFEVQMKAMEAETLHDWISQDNSRYWWLN